MRNNNHLRETVAANIRAELGRSRITQAKLASRANISPASLSKRLNGHLPFDIDQIATIADLVGVDPAALLSGASAKAAS